MGGSSAKTCPMGVCRTEPESVYFHITDEWATTHSESPESPQEARGEKSSVSSRLVRHSRMSRRLMLNVRGTL